jgi:hypothetical protein
MKIAADVIEAIHDYENGESTLQQFAERIEKCRVEMAAFDKAASEAMQAITIGLRRYAIQEELGEDGKQKAAPLLCELRKLAESTEY